MIGVFSSLYRYLLGICCLVIQVSLHAGPVARMHRLSTGKLADFGSNQCPLSFCTYLRGKLAGQNSGPTGVRAKVVTRIVILRWASRTCM